MLLDDKLDGLSYDVVGCAMRVHSALGSGFPEIIYQRALGVEFRRSGISFEAEIHLPVFYEGESVGARRVDFLVADQLIVELKATSDITDAHVAQVIDYLKAYKKEVGLLLNFGTASLQHRRYLRTQTPLKPK